MTLKQYKIYFTEQLSSIYPQTEIATFFSYLIEEYLGLQRIDLIIQPDFEISSEKELLFNKAVKRLQKEEPIQYIIGNTEFYGFPFLVNENTLIPRPETEELVEWILVEVTKLQSKEESKVAILDIGTGTGCIPISLKKNLPNANISAIDVSINALKKAIENAKLNNVTINFIEQDILKTTSLNFITSKTGQFPTQKGITSSETPRNDEEKQLITNVIASKTKQSPIEDKITSSETPCNDEEKQLITNVIASKMKQSPIEDKITSSETPRNDEEKQLITNVIASKTKQSLGQKETTSLNNDIIKFDIIVSNPPYVRELEKVEIKNNVLENEPHLALFVDDDNPLIFYNKIADLAKNHLTKNGYLFFEINQYLGKETVDMLKQKGFKNIELRKDFSGNDRMIKTNL